MAKKKAKKATAAPATAPTSDETTQQQPPESKKPVGPNYEALVGDRVDAARKIGLNVSVQRAFGTGGGLDLFLPGKRAGDLYRVSGGMGAKEMSTFLQGSVWGWRMAVQAVKEEQAAAKKARAAEAAAAAEEADE